MNDHAQNASGALTDQDIVDLTQRPSDAYNEVVLQADYTTRATLSFYRFRQLGGDYRVQNENYLTHKKKLAARKKANEAAGTGGEAADQAERAPERSRKLRLGESTGRGVHYVSSHPKVPLFQMSIIALMILFESAANAYFFAKQSEFGLAGGIFQAAAVSLANVAVSFFIIGYWGLRHVSMPLDWSNNGFNRRNLYVLNGLIAIIIGSILVLLVNLSAAHYRNILDIQALGLEMPDGIGSKIFPHFMVNPNVCEAILTSDLGNTIGSAATNAMCRPFAIHSLDAMVLLALGLAIASVAAFEGRRLDSPFPGFSDAARSLENARTDLEYAIDDFNQSYEDIFELVSEIKGGPLTSQEKMVVMNTMADMMRPYQNLLRTSDQILSDEFGLEEDIIKLLKVNAAGAG